MSPLHSAALASVSALALLSGAPAFAQVSPTAAAPESAGAAQLDELVVTASKTGAQTLQRTPLAIQAFSGEDLKKKNVQDIGGLIAGIPGASIAQETAAGIKSFNIRGVGVGGTNGETPIGYYLDDVPFVVPNFGIAPPIRFLDIAQVEVLRGPQGTLYGQGSAGGTMIFHTRDPDLNEVQTVGEAYASGTADASGANWGFSGALSVPLIQDVLAVRVSGGASKQQGYGDEYFGANDGTPDRKGVNGQKNSDWRVAALFRPTEDVALRGQIWQFHPRQGFTSLASSTDPYTYQQTAGVQGYADSKFTLYSLAADIHLGAVAVTSSTSYLKGAFGSRSPLGPFGIPGGRFDSFFFPKNFSQELRARSTGAGPLHWVAGATYSDGEGPQSNLVDYVAFTQDASNSTTTKNWAGFGEVSYDLLGGKLVPLLGVRYYHDRRAYEDATSTLPTTRHKTTWRANLSYLPTSDLTVFVTVSTGFRVNTVQSALQVQLIQADGLPAKYLLDPLSLTNYETGMKARMFDGALRLGMNLYHMKYEGVQSSFVTSVGVGGFINIGKAHSTGLDLDLSWQTPIEGLSLAAVGNINSSEYDDVDPRITLQFPNVKKGGRLVSSAEFNYRLEANYTRRLANDFELFGAANFSKISDRPTIAGVVAPSGRQVGATLGLRRGPYEIALFGENLTDARTPTDYFLPVLFTGPTPRTVGIRLRKTF
ncbi:MAG TPA: TonB-dependent receptor [Caulobacter sp.]|nr:TonB-dependent receptor [Caulobacter sp.]